MDTPSLMFPLGQHYYCVVEKDRTGWQLRVLEAGETIVTHRIPASLGERLLSARRAPSPHQYA